MTDWADPATANPIVDLAKAYEHVRGQTGIRPTVLVMAPSVKKAYVETMERHAHLAIQLAALPPRAYWRRYKIECQMWGKRHMRRKILRGMLPVRFRRLLSEIERRRANWKHRNDPYWESW